MTQLMQQTLYVHFAGQREEVAMADLGLKSNATDAQIKMSLVSHFDIPEHFLMNHVVVRTSQGIIVRPKGISG